MKTFITLLLLLTSPIIILSQQKIVGEVIDSTTNKPIPFVTVSTSDFKYGTITNSDGDFSLNISAKAETLSNDTIYFSHIGYKKGKLSINQFDSTRQVLELKPITYTLEEVTVRPYDSHYDINEVLSKVRNNYKGNYPTNETKKKIHLRQYFMQESNIKRMIDIESGISIRSYRKRWPVLLRSNPEIKISLLSGIAGQDSSDFAQLNYPPSIFLDIYHLPQTLITYMARNMECYTFEINPQFNNENTFLNVNYNYKPNCTLKMSGSLLINQSNYAIENFVFHTKKNGEIYENKKVLGGDTLKTKYKPLSAIVEISFQQINSKYQLSYAHVIDSLVLINPNNEIPAEIHHHLHTTSYNSKELSFERKAVLDRNEDLLEQIKKNNSKLSKYINVRGIKLTPSEKKFLDESRLNN